MDQVKVENEEQRNNKGREAEGRVTKETLDRVELENIQSCQVGDIYQEACTCLCLWFMILF